MDPSSDDEYQPDDSDFEAGVTSGLEALRHGTKSRGARGLRKRRREPRQPAVPVSLKRRRGAFNAQYLGLLNEDIRDAAAGIIHEGEVPLGYTQVGAVGWSTTEKEAFFSALGRLGRDDLAGIASRIRTKSEPEVRQYMILLDDFDRARREDEDKRHRTLQPVDVPAALEVGQECCIALEHAADSLALRQERHEEALERKRWHNRWLITPSLARVLDNQHRRGQDIGLPFAELFAIRTWLRLSERIFMNSAVLDGNWRTIEPDEDDEGEAEPSVRATAFADFHALAVSVTRRLVLASLYVASSRVRAKNAGDPRHRARPLVHVHDVRAAAASVGMKQGSQAFWAGSARRLRLEVIDDARGNDNTERSDAEEGDRTDGYTSDDSEIYKGTSEDDEEERESAEEKADIESSSTQDDDYETMTYDAVEAVLGYPSTATPQDTLTSDVDLSDAMSISSLPSSSSSARSTGDESEHDHDHDHDPTDPLLTAAIDRDLAEATHYSAIPHPHTSRGRQALRARIRAEHLLEAEAEAFDSRAGAREEVRLWGLLRSSGGEKEKKEEKDKGEEGPTTAVDSKDKDMDMDVDEEGDEDEDYEEEDGGDEDEHEDEEADAPTRERRAARRRLVGLVDTGPDWRDGLRYYSEWENRVGGDR